MYLAAMPSPSRQQPEQQAPPVQRLRIRYAKRGRMRFTSHRDFSRAFERAIARAGVPMAYSSGFHPHPRISYANAAPTGAASEAEYVEIGLSEVSDAAAIAASIDESLPPGLDVVEIVESNGGSLADRLEASRWLCRLPNVTVAQAEESVAVLQSRDEVLVERMTKRGLREFDVRGAMVSIAVTESEPSTSGVVPETCAILDVVLRHGVPAVRPDDVLAGLRSITGLDASAALFTRLAQGPLDETGTVGDPLAHDRDAPGM